MRVTILIQKVEYKDGLVICPMRPQIASVTGDYANVRELDAAVDFALGVRIGAVDAQLSLLTYDQKMRGFDAYKRGPFQAKRYLQRSPVWDAVA